MDVAYGPAAGLLQVSCRVGSTRDRIDADDFTASGESVIGYPSATDLSPVAGASTCASCFMKPQMVPAAAMHVSVSSSTANSSVGPVVA